ncbi:MAG: hypothetical protein K6U89_20155, partial [Chloroflexi bacterium]|nr:hypothetical protein [Chloroflexota bacterium]
PYDCAPRVGDSLTVAGRSFLLSHRLDRRDVLRLAGASALTLLAAACGVSGGGSVSPATPSVPTATGSGSAPA